MEQKKNSVSKFSAIYAWVLKIETFELFCFNV